MHRPRAGFTLVELSIVLVIIGLLAGGVFVGQSLIHSAGLQKNAKWQMTIKSEFDAFTDKYNAYPGDMANATSIWGNNTTWGWTGCTGGTPSATGTCNGNGNGYIDWDTGSYYEEYLLIQQLQLAGMDTTAMAANTHIQPTGATGSTYWQVPGTDSGYAFVGGGTSPYADLYEASPPNGILATGNGLQMGTRCTSRPAGSLFTPADALYIDSKIDDGMPTTGIFLAANGENPSNCSTTFDSCLSASGSSYIYNASNSSIACRTIFMLTQK